MARRLIVNADDFGRSPAITAGILEAHARGIVTSTSLMVRWPYAEEAIRLLGDHPRLGVGLHLDLGEWAFRGGEWVASYSVVDLEDEDAVEAEARAQLERFRSLTGRAPTHIDSHQHVHRADAPREAARRLASDLAVPLRGEQVRYCGDFYGRMANGEPLPDAITGDALIRVIRDLPEGTTELACHPGQADEDDDLYGEERPREVEALTDPRVRAAIDEGGIELISFADVR